MPVCDKFRRNFFNPSMCGNCNCKEIDHKIPTDSGNDKEKTSNVVAAPPSLRRLMDGCQSGSTIPKNPGPEESDEFDDTESVNSTADSAQNSIFIWGLPLNMSEQNLFDTLWGEFSRIGQTKINQETNKPYIHLFKRKDNRALLNGTATITFEKEESIEKAIRKYHEQCVRSLQNAQIRVKKSEPTKQSPLRENSIFIWSLPLNISEQYLFDTLWDEFSLIGQIKINQETNKPCIHLFKRRDNPTQLSGMATIAFEKEESVEKAIREYNEQRVSSLNNAQIGVKKSKKPSVLNSLAMPRPIPTPPPPVERPIPIPTPVFNQPNGKVSVYWDIENVAIPRGQNAFNIVMELRRRLIESRKLTEKHFTAYCNTNILPQEHQIGLNHANVNIMHIPSCTKAGDADRKIFMDLQTFKEQTPSPATIVLISGDIDFVQFINRLRFGHGHYIIVVHNQLAKKELLQTANEAYLWHEFCDQEIPPVVKANNLHKNIAKIDLSDHTLPRNGKTVAGGNGKGNAPNQLNNPEGIFVDDDQTMIIVDSKNARVIQCKINNNEADVIAGGRGAGEALNQLNRPTDVVIDKQTNSIIVSDWGNQRIVRWSRRSGTNVGEILLDNIQCSTLAMDHQRYLYISDTGKSEVRRYRIGEKNGTLVAGGHGRGSGFNQLNWPTYIFVDQQESVYVSDSSNDRVMKWDKYASEGSVIAGGQGRGSGMNQLSYPQGLFVDRSGNIYVADRGNRRVMRWMKGSREGSVILGKHRDTNEAKQFGQPRGLFFDQYNNVYVVDSEKHRVQGFSIE